MLHLVYRNSGIKPARAVLTSFTIMLKHHSLALSCQYLNSSIENFCSRLHFSNLNFSLLSATAMCRPLRRTRIKPELYDSVFTVKEKSIGGQFNLLNWKDGSYLNLSFSNTGQMLCPIHQHTCFSQWLEPVEVIAPPVLLRATIYHILLRTGRPLSPKSWRQDLWPIGEISRYKMSSSNTVLQNLRDQGVRSSLASSFQRLNLYFSMWPSFCQDDNSPAFLKCRQFCMPKQHCHRKKVRHLG